MKKIIRHILKQTIIKPLLYSLVLVFSVPLLHANEVDIGIFQSGPNEVEIRMRPDFEIPVGTNITNLQYTVRWPVSQPGISQLNLINPYNIPFGAQYTHNGFVYQNFIITIPITIGTTINASEEVVISTFEFPGGALYFELVNDAFTDMQNISFYIELDGFSFDNTGTIYRQMAFLPVAAWSILLLFTLLLAFTVFRFSKMI